MRALALIFLIALTAPAAAQEISLTPAQARGLAQRAFVAGDYLLANDLAHGLLLADRNDVAALLLLAATEPLFGRAEEGRRAGARAWQVATAPGLRHEAAFYTARATVFERRFTPALLWLRRAYQTAETDAQKQRVAVDYQRVKAVSPWTSSLNFSVAPSSNINGGSKSGLLLIDDFPAVGVLSGSAQALSGVTETVEASLGYKLARGPGRETRLTFNGLHSFNQMSAEAKALAPESSGSDFNQAVAELVLEHRLDAPPGPLPDSYAATLGYSWFGGEALDYYARLGLERRFDLSETTALRFGLQAEQHWSLTGAADTLGTEARIDLSRRLASGDQLSLGLGLIDVRSDSINQDYTGWEAEIGLALARPIGPVALSLSLGYREKDFPAYAVGTFGVPGGRDDAEITASVNLRLRDAGYLGFEPVITLSGARSTSNISRFEGQTIGISLGFQSAF